ncbi:NAD(P)-dependent oxidoreductase [Nonomuraea sp. MCN248]|uniref:NAD(P)-dependent oxidoreductase n=1 Tax=Nonomuraea corallina TaxID=2989783 RepID=A0ABT4SL86_9ACTN|nr:NAD(P)-dependent oxidoreductase [Nonomuraea corallina]MDA0637740.1 NAD(P)-dependent oxidoreductase [Nonomuraea corallina]
MTYLVTGATGFIGSYVVDRLLRDGHRVVALDRRPEWAREPAAPDPSALTAVEGDVTDFSLVADLVSGHRVDRVIHLAAELHDRSAAQRGQCIQSNIVGTYNVLEAARLFGVTRTVLASSAALFSPAHHDPARPIAEDARIHGGDVYEGSKIFGETMGEYYLRTLGVANTSIRIGLAYGAACLIGTARRLIDELVTKPLAGEPGRPAYHAGSMMNMVYIHDTADAFVRASQGPAPSSPVYHVRGDYRSVGDMVEVARKLIPGAVIEPGDSDHRWPMNFDDSLFRREYGYATRWSLEDALADIVAERRSQAA